MAGELPSTFTRHVCGPGCGTTAAGGAVHVVAVEIPATEPAAPVTPPAPAPQERTCSCDARPGQGHRLVCQWWQV